MKALLLLSILILGQSAFAAMSGNDKGNGGDLCEARFYQIRNDILNWINNGDAVKLKLPPTITFSEYNFGMKKQLTNATVECVTEKLTIDGAEKTCINQHRDGKPYITCNLERFMAIFQSEQYTLVHHEYAGLSGFETNDGIVSKYDISNQISGFLKTSNTQKLVIRPEANTSELICNNDLSKFQAIITKTNIKFSVAANNYWKSLALPEIVKLFNDTSVTSLNFKMPANSCLWNFNDQRLSCNGNDVEFSVTNTSNETKQLRLSQMQISTGIIGTGKDSVQVVSMLITTQDGKMMPLKLFYSVQAASIFTGTKLCGKNVY